MRGKIFRSACTFKTISYGAMMPCPSLREDNEKINTKKDKRTSNLQEAQNNLQLQKSVDIIDGSKQVSHMTMTKCL